MEKTIELITYGHFLNKDEFREISKQNKHYYLNKPTGGIWASPVESSWGWKDWCAAEDYNTKSLKTYTKWKLKDPKKILVINGIEDLKKAMSKYVLEDDPYAEEFPYNEYHLDFWKIKEDGWDGMWLTTKGNSECHYHHPVKGGYISLNTWDCESIVVWNWDQVIILEQGRL